MKQLVQLQQQAEDFKKLNTELVFVFREESDGVDGLKKIEEKVQPANRKTFVLGLDPNKKSSAAYSSKKRTFDNYVIDSKGIVRGKVDGSLKDRATANELLKILGEIEK
jgi:alkyl hydroperoxide reductase subunit AhpC